MAITYIIGGIQLVSAVISLLALGSFWVTPALRTTANRFVINLLVVNVVGCLALTPALWLNGGLRSSIHSTNNEQNSGPCNKADYFNEAFQTSDTEKNLSPDRLRSSKIFLKNKCFYSSGQLECLEQFSDNKINDGLPELSGKQMRDDKNDNSDIRKKNENTVKCRMNSRHLNSNRFWGLDLAAALGGLSVLLVVGDTWCAITDPLRYHSRISGPKSWMLIGANWCIGITCSIGSMFQTNYQLGGHSSANSSFHRNEIHNFLKHPQNKTESIEIYDLVYSIIFFIVIILFPICVISIMYWKIFSEAKQNGQRMRQNGSSPPSSSSPLLQSALNLITAPPVLPSSRNNFNFIYKLSRTDRVSDIISTRRHTADYSNICMNDNELNKSIELKKADSDTQKQSYSQYLDIPRIAEGILGDMQTNVNETNHTLENIANNNKCDTKPCCKLHRLAVQEQPDTYCNEVRCQENVAPFEIRHVHSSPNLQELVISSPVNRTTSIPKNYSCTRFHSSSQEFSDRLPSVCAPPKALSYMSSIRHRLSNASSIFKYREESRTARISILVIIFFLISYFPYGLLVLLERQINLIDNPSLLGIIFLLTANICFPCIFAYRNKRVRRGVCRIFGMDAKNKERLQRRQIKLHAKNNDCHIANEQELLDSTLIQNSCNVSICSIKSTLSRHLYLPKIHTTKNTQRCDKNSLKSNSILIMCNDDNKKRGDKCLKSENSLADDGYSSNNMGNDSDG